MYRELRTNFSAPCIFILTGAPGTVFAREAVGFRLLERRLELELSAVETIPMAMACEFEEQ